MSDEFLSGISGLQVFQFESQNLRTFLVDGAPWFIAKDVCDVLDISNPSMAVQSLDDDERAKFNLGRQGETNVVNEYGLFALVLKSRKPEAKSFKRWITHEVIPSIRKTGSYSAPGANSPATEREVRMALLKTAYEHEERLGGIEQRIETVERKVEEQITLDSGSQRTVQKAVARRVYDLTDGYKERRELFNQLHREIKDRWAVPSYKDIRKTELSEVLKYIDAWKPRIA